MSRATQGQAGQSTSGSGAEGRRTVDPTLEALQRIFHGETVAQLDRVAQEQVETAYEAGCTCVDREDFEDALAHMLCAVTHDPYEFRFQFGFALCLHQLGRVAEAAKHYGLACMLDPSDAGTAFRLGECHVAMGDRDAAAEAFETASALCDPPTLQPELRLACARALQRLHG